MTESLAIEIAMRKMRESGKGDNYLLTYRHLQLAPGASRQIEAKNTLMLLIQPWPMIMVLSQTGVFDLEDTAINEMQYVHKGSILITNHDTENFSQVKFLQVIPSNSKK